MCAGASQPICLCTMTHLRTRAVHVGQHPAVHYSGLPGHPQHALAQRQLQGGFGGMVSFELARSERAAAAQVLNRLALFTQAVSLGDVDSLACHPASTTHSFVSPEARAANGVTEGLIRLSVGIEHPDDLIADLDRALAL